MGKPHGSRKVSSTESTSSVASTSSARAGAPRELDPSAPTHSTAAVTTAYSRHLTDVCAMLIHCPRHERFALVPCNAHRGLWLPYVALRQSEGWYAAIVNKVRKLLGVRVGIKSSSVFTAPELMHLMRIQMPEVFKYVTRAVYMTNLQSMNGVGSPSVTNCAAIRSEGGKSHPKSIDSNSSNQASFKCQCDNPINGCRWLRHEQIVAEEEALEIWGPEPAIFTSAFATNSVERGAYSEYTLREAIRFQPKEQPRTYQEEMLKSCNFEQSDILRLYSDYIQHCYPSQNMNYVSFSDYVFKLGYEPSSFSSSPTTTPAAKEGVSTSSTSSNSSGSTSTRSLTVGSNNPAPNLHDFRALYRAFKFGRMPYVTFHELLLGLAAMDRSTAHGGHPGELRCAYIFRYYDSNADGVLSGHELRQMAADRLRLASLSKTETANKSNSGSNSGSSSAAAAADVKPDNTVINKELSRIYHMLGLKHNSEVDELGFMTAVGKMQLRGTSHLFRSQTSVLPVKQHYEIIRERHALTDIEGNLVGSELQRKGTCPRCKEKRYTLALHSVKMTHDAQIIEPTELRFDEYPPPISRAQRALSRAVFAIDSTPNRLVDMITNYWNSYAAAQLATGSPSGNSGGGSGSGGGAGNLSNASMRTLLGINNAVPLGKTVWERVDRNTLAEDIKRLCSQADAMFKREARIVPVTSPCIVLGDIHGNISDLRTYERILWPGAPTCTTGSYLFLGDYVDRGDHGLECILYLLCMKVLAPKTFFLLRGNHELRSIQQAFTFFREVSEKFRDQKLGIQVWEVLNKTFDLMPVAATIDDQIFCSHGGIPTSAQRLDELHNIPSPLPDPENQSPAAWEILWNDPVSLTEYTEYADLLRKQPGGQQAVANMQGYLPNTKRGTAFFYSEEAVKRFLNLNNLTHIIRAHECVPPGYALHCNGKVITIFSSSHYCGATNDAACVLVERERLRIIRLDTD